LSRSLGVPEVGGDGVQLVAVAFANSRVEAEMIKGLLENDGIPSLLQPAGLNMDGPQLGYGVLASGVGGGAQRLMGWSLVIMAAAFGIFLLLRVV
jgi:hypothetical protein